MTEKIAVIVNDFGSVVFDGMRLSVGADVEILDVPGGCLCCSAIEDFQVALRQVIERGAGRIFIEATGLADAEQVQRDLAFMRFPIDSTLCVVDALNLHRFQKLFHIVNAQIKAADFLLISKSDLLSKRLESKPDSLALLEQKLRTLNPRAALTFLNKGRMDTAFLLQAFAPAERFVPNEDATEYSQEHFLPEHLLYDGITAFRVHLPESVDFPTLERVLSNLPPNLVRLKGLVRLDSSPRPVLLNFVAGAWNYQPLAEDVASETLSGAPNELFAIGQHLTSDSMKSAWEALGARLEAGTVRGLGVRDSEDSHAHH